MFDEIRRLPAHKRSKGEATCSHLAFRLRFQFYSFKLDYHF